MHSSQLRIKTSPGGMPCVPTVIILGTSEVQNDSKIVIWSQSELEIEKGEIIIDKIR